MNHDTSRWSADVEISRVPWEHRHVICPFGYEVFESASGLLCRTCFSSDTFRSEAVAAPPCSCASPRAPGKVTFAEGHWTARCARCQSEWRGAHRLGDHGRWEASRPQAVRDRPAGVRGPEWLFDQDLTITGSSSGSLTFSTKPGMRVTVGVVLPDRPRLPGQLEPFNLSFATNGRWDRRQDIIPDQATRERLRAAIDTNIRERLEGAMRGEESLMRARGLVKYASQVFDLLR
jgi:hypothetical protein